MNGKIWLRIFAALVMVAAIAGIGFFAYQAGVAHGSPVTIQSPSGQTVPAPYFYGYGMPWHPFFGFGCFAPLVLLFLFFLAMKSFRMMMWGPRWGWGGHMHGPMMHGRWGERGVPPMVEEWHKRMHGEQPAEDKKA